jgi:cob(I)alamin adenosyltransferase
MTDVRRGLIMVNTGSGKGKTTAAMGTALRVGAEKPDPEDVRLVEEAWAEGARAIQSGEWDQVILDEINYAISYGILDPAKVVETLKQKPELVHVILTGRNAHPTIIELADTVTEMRQVKHAYEKGVMAQTGIGY